MRFLSNNKYSQDFFGNIYNVDKKILNKKTPISKTVKNSRYNSKYLQIRENKCYFILKLSFLSIRLKQVEIFKLRLITCMVKIYIFYSYIKDKNF